MAKAREAPPHKQLETFEKDLAAATEMPRITVVRGAEKWFHQEALALAVARAKALGMQTNQHEPADPDYNPAGLFGDLTGGSLFGDPIFIVAREAGVLCKKSGTKDSEFVAALKAYCKGGEPVGAVLVLAPTLRGDHAVVKLAKAYGVALNFRSLYDSPPAWKPDPRDVELVHWVRARAKHHGLALKQDEAVYLAGAVGNDLGALDSELKKLSVTGTDELRASVGWQSGGTPWDVADKLLGEHLAEAVGAVESLFAKGFQGKDKKRVLDPAALVSMLSGSLLKGVRAGLAVSEARAQGLSKDAAMALAGIGGAPQTREAALQRATRRTGVEWSAMLEALLDIERRFKTGGTADANDFILFATRFALRRR
jgi:DNA polymerase III delta subunit